MTLFIWKNEEAYVTIQPRPLDAPIYSPMIAPTTHTLDPIFTPDIIQGILDGITMCHKICVLFAPKRVADSINF